MISDIDVIRTYSDPVVMRIDKQMTMSTRTPRDVSAIIGLPVSRVVEHMQRMESKGLLVNVSSLSGQHGLPPENIAYGLRARILAPGRKLLAHDSPVQVEVLRAILSWVLIDAVEDIERSHRGGCTS